MDTNDAIEQYKLVKNDLLMSLTGNVGRVGLLPDYLLPAALNQRVACLKSDKGKINKRFLFYLLNQDIFEQSCIASSKGIAQKNLSTVWLSKFKIPLPPLEVQEQISTELDNYQKIIDGARQVVENYKSHIDIDSEWPTIKLGDVCNFKRGPFGGSLKKEIFVETGYCVYEQRHAISGSFEQVRYFINSEKFKEMKQFEVKPGDLIMSCSGTMGKVAIAPDNTKRGIINQALLRLTALEKLDKQYLKYILESSIFQKALQDNAYGAAIKNVASVGALKDIKIALPNLKIQKDIVKRLDNEQKLIDSSGQLIKSFEQKIKNLITKVWGEKLV